MAPPPFTAIDLCAGAGGTALGFRRAGFLILAALEIDPDAAATYELNIGVRPTVADLRAVDADRWRSELGLAPGDLDVLIGCPPCQGFTRLRGKDGVDDPRNDLVCIFVEFVLSFRPKLVVFENVPGFVKGARGKVFHDQLVAALIRAGYRPSEALLDAADFGTPQHRLRFLLMAGLGYKPRLPERTHGAPDDPAVIAGTLKPWRTVRDAIGHLPPLAPGEECKEVPNHRASVVGPRVLEFIKLVPKNGGSRAEVPRSLWLPCHLKHDGHKDVFGRLAWDAPASAVITSGCINPSKGRFVHPEQDRGLTPREAAALQGFPDWYTFVGGHLSTAAQIGNAFPPPFAEAVARASADFLVEWYTRDAALSNGEVAQVGHRALPAPRLPGMADRPCEVDEAAKVWPGIGLCQHRRQGSKLAASLGRVPRGKTREPRNKP